VLRHPYLYNREVASDEARIDCGGESRTKQSFKDECDINVIVRRFGVTGVAPGTTKVPMYGDFSDVGDFSTCVDRMMQAQANFDTLPSDVRRRFRNDPQEFLEFCSNPGNLDEMRKLGLAIPKKEDPAAAQQ